MAGRLPCSPTDEERTVVILEGIHRMSVDEYTRVADELGWDRTELVEGVVYDVTPEHNRHADTVMDLLALLQRAFPDDRVRVVGSVRLGDDTILVPDAYVIDGAHRRDPDGPVPAGAVRLAVEVSVTTQAHDRGPKLAAYAAAGVPQVWLIDPRPGVGTLLRHRDPADGRYRSVVPFAVGENAGDLDVDLVLGG